MSDDETRAAETRLFALYRRVACDQPPRELDRAILQAARLRSVAHPGRAVLLALAASLVLGVALSVWWPHAHPARPAAAPFDASAGLFEGRVDMGRGDEPAADAIAAGSEALTDGL